MTTWGLTPEGLVIPRLADIKKEYEELLRTNVDPNLILQPETLEGQIVDISAERESKLWELYEDVYDSQYPDSAQDVSLHRVGSITAFTQLPALASTIIGQALFGTIGTIIPVGIVFSVENAPESKFSTQDAVTLVAGVDEIQRLTFSVAPSAGSFKLRYTKLGVAETTVAIDWDDENTDIENKLNELVKLSGTTVNGKPTVGPVDITFAGDDGNQPQVMLEIIDNTLTNGGGAVTITPTEQTPGEYQGQVNLRATETGPISAVAGSLNQIDTPLSGLDSTFNPEDAALGRNIESDSEYKIRRAQRLQISQSGPVEAIRAALLNLNEDTQKIQLESVKVFENVTDITDTRGLPPHSIEAIVYQAGSSTTRDQEIADTIWLNSKCAGIQPHGDVSKTVVDSQGFSHTSKFSRPTDKDIYLILDLTTNSLYPIDGDDQVKATMVAWGNDLGVGVSVIIRGSDALTSQFDSIPGIIGIGVKIGFAPNPTLDDNLIIDDGIGGNIELSRWDTAIITVNS